MNQQEAINRLNSLNVSNKCDKCGGIKAVDQNQVQIVMGSGGSISKTYDGFTMSCGDCGHLDIFKTNIPS